MAASGQEFTLIGLCDGELDSNRHPSSYLTNKVGDQPDVLPVISWQHPHCNLCGAPLAHVVQLYCPLAASPYHRNLHLFACPRRAESWKVLRSQCLETEVTPPSRPPAELVAMTTTHWCDGADDWCDGADDWGVGGGGGGGGLNEETPEETHEEVHVSSRLQDLSLGGGGGLDEETPEEVHVSRRLQDLSLGGAEQQTRQDVPVLRPFYVSVVEEADLAGEEDLDHAEELLREYERREGAAVVGALEAGGGEEKYEKTKARHGDAVFSRFMKRISRCPEQILRYCWDGEPLFVSEPPSNVAQMVPVCRSCGGSRTFELQLMPALVSLLRSRDSGSEVDLEFGTVLVYSCRRSCWTPGWTSPLEEFTLVQTDPDQRFFK